MNWRMVKRDTTPAVLGMAMIGNLLLSIGVALRIGTVLQQHRQNATLGAIIGILLFLAIGTFLFWITAVIMDRPASETDIGKLEVLSGVYQGVQLKLSSAEVLVLGSDPAISQLIFHATGVSGRHCRIQYDVQRQRYLLTDYSREGVYLEDGTRLPMNQVSPIRKGSTIQIGYTDNFIRLA